MAKTLPRPGGKGQVLTEIDLLEISATSMRAHPATRVLGWKSADPDADQALSLDDLRAMERELDLEPPTSSAFAKTCANSSTCT